MTDPRIDRWSLPDGVDELLPAAAWRVEQLRRKIVDRFRVCGFELVMPPLVEYLDSLLTGSGETMDLQTFKLIDQHNGRMLGVRADMTPQVARIDAHALGGDAPNRLCYTGSVLRARADGAGGSRSPQHFGAELFGHSGVESDVEMIRLMLETIALSGMAESDCVLDLGHVGVYRALVREASLDTGVEEGVYAALQRGSLPDVRVQLDLAGANSPAAERLLALCSLRGGRSVIASARDVLGGAGPQVFAALDTLEQVADAIAASHPDIALLIDLSELRGFRYHTGMLFAVLDSSGATLANGGRYDGVSEAFGRARAATGFSGDLKQLADRDACGLAAASIEALVPPAIYVSSSNTAAAWQEIGRLRSSGECVLCGLPGSADAGRRCDRELVRDGEGWMLRPFDSSSTAL